MLKGCRTLALTVRSRGHISNHFYSWVDPHGRSVSPPPDPGEADQQRGGGVEERTVGAAFNTVRWMHLPAPCCCSSLLLLSPQTSGGEQGRGAAEEHSLRGGLEASAELLPPP